MPGSPWESTGFADVQLLLVSLRNWILVAIYVFSDMLRVFYHIYHGRNIEVEITQLLQKVLLAVPRMWFAAGQVLRLH